MWEVESFPRYYFSLSFFSGWPHRERRREREREMGGVVHALLSVSVSVMTLDFEWSRGVTWKSAVFLDTFLPVSLSSLGNKIFCVGEYPNRLNSVLIFFFFYILGQFELSEEGEWVDSRVTWKYTNFLQFYIISLYYPFPSPQSKWPSFEIYGIPKFIKFFCISEHKN